jgi:hypothetical protein
LHEDLVEKYPGTSSDTDVFQASRGWFEKFKKRSGIHSVVRHGEAASSNQKAFRNILKHRQKQITLDKLFVRQRPRESQAESSGAKTQKREKEETPGRQLPDVFMEGDSPSKQ